MGVKLCELENVKKKGNSIVARCPACAEMGNDRKGNHLFINGKGQFSCVVNPGMDGKQHRKRIFELVGIKDPPGKGIYVKKPSSVLGSGYKVIQKDVLGRLGRV